MSIYSKSSIQNVITGGSGSRKTNALLNLIRKQDNDSLIDKISLYAKDLNKPKYQFLIKKRENLEIKHLNDSKAFVEYSQCMDDVYNNIDDYNPLRKRKSLIVFDDMIANIMSNKKFQAVVKELILFFIPKEVRLNSIHFLTTKIHNKRESQNIATNHSADIDYKDFMEICRKCTIELYSFLAIDTYYITC